MTYLIKIGIKLSKYTSLNKCMYYVFNASVKLFNATVVRKIWKPKNMGG